jgi:hypothetical protein
MYLQIKHKYIIVTIFCAVIGLTNLLGGAYAGAAPSENSGGGLSSPATTSGSGPYYCGADNATNGTKAVRTSIDIGCKGVGNPIADAAFAVIRFLSNGVGLVVIASIIWGGIQYTTSRGDPQATAKAVGRIRSSLIALLIFIFSYALLNYIVPGVFLQ